MISEMQLNHISISCNMYVQLFNENIEKCKSPRTRQQRVRYSHKCTRKGGRRGGLSLCNYVLSPHTFHQSFVQMTHRHSNPLCSHVSFLFPTLAAIFLSRQHLHRHTLLFPQLCYNTRPTKCGNHKRMNESPRLVRRPGQYVTRRATLHSL